MKLLKKIGLVFFVLLILGAIVGSYDKSSSITSTGNSNSNQIIISYSANKTDYIVSSLGSVSMPQEGKIFLVVTTKIENRGYGEFSTSPLFFKIISNSIEYGISPYSYSLEDKLDSVKLLNGGSTQGSVAFEVPSDIENYQFKYDGLGFYKIIYKTI